MKINPLQDVQAVHFEMMQPQANHWIDLLAEILNKILRTLGELPDQNSKQLVYLLSGCEDVLFDGAGKPILHLSQEDRMSLATVVKNIM